MSKIIEVLVPDIGGATDVDVIEVLVNVGDVIEKDDSIASLESDKASMEVPSSDAGTVKEIHIKVGDKVSEGSVLLTLESNTDVAEKEAPQPVESSSEKAEEPEKIESAPKVTSAPKSVNVIIPDIGDAKDVDVIEVLVQPGDSIEKEQSLLTLEGDKATMEIPSSHSGKVESVLVKVGDKANQGDVVATLLSHDGEGSEKQAVTKAPAVKEQPESSPKTEKAKVDAEQVSFFGVYASPSIKRLAREFGVDLTKVKGTGRKSRITREDVKHFVKQAINKPQGGLLIDELPAIDFSKFGKISEKPLNKIKQLTAKAMTRSWLTIPHVTQFDEADTTELESFRQAQKQAASKQGVKLTPLAFIVKACVSALKAFPTFNASLDKSGEKLIIKEYYHIGIAVDTPNGLVVPVIRDADKLSVMDIASEMGVISEKARDGKLTPKDMSGGSFTVSSLGGISGTGFTPIVNSPEVAILGVSRSKWQPVLKDSEFVPRLMLPFSLSYDHRVIDGAEAARFTKYLAQCLTDIRQLLL